MASPCRASGLPRSGDHIPDKNDRVWRKHSSASSIFIGRGSMKGPAFPLSPENQLLTACAAPRVSPEKIRELIRPDLNWHFILDRAAELGIAPLTYSHLKISGQESSIPPEILNELRSRRRDSAVTAIRQSAKLKEILWGLRSKQIPAIVMKGAALGELLYESAGLRPMLDVDLMIRNEDLDAATKVLVELGYSCDESYQEAGWYKSHHHHLAPFVSSDRSVVVELHYELASPQANLAIATDALWQRARPFQIASDAAMILAPEDLLLGICAHVAISKRFVKSLRDLAEIAAVIERYCGEIQWEDVVGNAIAWRAARCAYYGLWAARLLTGAEVPPEVLDQLKSETKLSSGADVCVKAMIPRALFPDSTILKPWLINDLIGEILCPQIGVTRTLRRRLLGYFKPDHFAETA
jgi:hypothetical protein